MHLIFSANGVLLFAALPDPLILFVFKLHSHETVTVFASHVSAVGGHALQFMGPRDTMLTIGVRN